MEKKKWEVGKLKGSFLVPREKLHQIPLSLQLLYIHLLGMAVFTKEGVLHKEYGVMVPRGSWIISYRELAKRLEMSLGMVQRQVKKLVELGEIEITELGKIRGKDGNQKRTMFTIVGYDELQSFPESIHPFNTPFDTPSDTPLQPLNPLSHAEFEDQEEDERYTNRYTHRYTPAEQKELMPLKNQFFNNECVNNQPTSEAWQTDEEYLWAKQKGGWLVGSDARIYHYFLKAKKQVTLDQLLEAWESYQRRVHLKDQNLAKFLSYEFKHYLPIEDDWFEKELAESPYASFFLES